MIYKIFNEYVYISFCVTNIDFFNTWNYLFDDVFVYDIFVDNGSSLQTYFVFKIPIDIIEPFTELVEQTLYDYGNYDKIIGITVKHSSSVMNLIDEHINSVSGFEFIKNGEKFLIDCTYDDFDLKTDIFKFFEC